MRYRLTSLGFEKIAAEVTLRNNCAETRHIKFSVRAGPTKDALFALGEPREDDFAPGEEKEYLYEWTNADGTSPRIEPTATLTFRWNWQRHDSTDLHCLDVGAESCLQTDAFLRSTVQELATVPAGVALLRGAAQYGVRLRRGQVVDGALAACGLPVAAR